MKILEFEQWAEGQEDDKMKVPCLLLGVDKWNSRLYSVTLNLRLLVCKMGIRKILSWLLHGLCKRVICLLQSSVWILVPLRTM